MVAVTLFSRSVAATSFFVYGYGKGYVYRLHFEMLKGLQKGYKNPVFGGATNIQHVKKTALLTKKRLLSG